MFYPLPAQNDHHANHHEIERHGETSPNQQRFNPNCPRNSVFPTRESFVEIFDVQMTLWRQLWFDVWLDQFRPVIFRSGKVEWRCYDWQQLCAVAHRRNGAGGHQHHQLRASEREPGTHAPNPGVDDEG